MSGYIANKAAVINDHIKRSLLPAQILTSKFPYTTSSSRLRSYFNDPSYFPTYYYLGRVLNPKNILDVNLGNAIPLACVIAGSDAAENVAGFQHLSEDDTYYSVRMAKHNLRRVYKGSVGLHAGYFGDKDFDILINLQKWDMIILNCEITYDEYLTYLRILWRNLADGGNFIVDRINYHKPAGKACVDFCLSLNISFNKVASKYGMALISKF